MIKGTIKTFLAFPVQYVIEIAQPIKFASLDSALLSKFDILVSKSMQL